MPLVLNLVLDITGLVGCKHSVSLGSFRLALDLECEVNISSLLVFLSNKFVTRTN
jgi:hypothetical protein